MPDLRILWWDLLQAHVGPVIALERSPFFDDIVLTCGDWQWQIWQEGQSTPLFQSGYAQDYYTAGEAATA